MLAGWPAGGSWRATTQSASGDACLGRAATQSCATVGGGCPPHLSVGPTDQTLSCKPHPRASGRAARRLPRYTRVLTLSVCKRRDAVRLALNEPARPAGAAFGGLSASA